MQTFDHRKYQAPAAFVMPKRQWPNQQIQKAPIWASVDLRDGNQALLEPMSVEQKKRMWQQLLKMGFKEIEVGFPSASQTEFDFVRWLIEAKQIPEDVSIQVLVQAREDLIKRTFESLQGVHKAIVHVYNSTSTIQRERVFQKSRDEITAIAVQGARWLQREAAKHPETRWQFQYSPESFTQTEMDYAVEICDAVIDVWQPTLDNKCIINLPATVEVTTPNIFADQVEYFASQIKHRDNIIISVHTHNDRGTAVAAAELALLAGADRVEGTLLGNGERTGNMDIVTMAMNLYSQGIDPKLELANPDEIIQVYSDCTQLPVHPRHPWIGELVYTAFSGSHQDAIRKSLQQQDVQEHWQVAYLPIDPRDIGRDYQAVIRVNSQSGKGGIAFVLERDYGLKLPRWMQIELAQLVQQASEQSAGEVNSTEIYRLFQQHFVMTESPLALEGYHLDRNGHDVIDVKLKYNTKSQRWQGEGDGAVAAFIHACEDNLQQSMHVIDYEEHAIGEGNDAVAVCYMQINVNGQRICAAAMDQDTVSASLKALISSLNRAAILQAKAA